MYIKIQKFQNLSAFLVWVKVQQGYFNPMMLHILDYADLSFHPCHAEFVMGAILKYRLVF